MSDPISGGVGEVAKEMVKELQEAMREAEKAAEATEAKENQAVEFSNVLGSRETQGIQQVAQATEAGATRDASQVLRVATANQRTVEAPAAGQSLDSGGLSRGIQRVMEEVTAGQNKLEQIINLSLSGRNFSTSELLALQAGVYRFTQELELTSKVIEKGTSSIKQTLNTQV